MPVAADRGFIFVHVPKAAGTSIERALRRHTELTLADRTPLSDETIDVHRLHITGELHRRERHLGAGEIERVIGRNGFASAFSFAFVRNPFDRLVSMYSFFTTNPNLANDIPQVRLARESGSFGKFVERALERDRYRPFFEQWRYLEADLDERGCLVEFVGRFERLQDDFAVVAKRIGIDHSLPTANQSAHAPYRDYYDRRLRSLVEEACAGDIERYEYSF